MARKMGRTGDVLKIRKATNDTKAAPSGAGWPLGSFGGGKLVDRGIKRGPGWKNS